MSIAGSSGDFPLLDAALIGALYFRNPCFNLVMTFLLVLFHSIFPAHQHLLSQGAVATCLLCGGFCLGNSMPFGMTAPKEQASTSIFMASCHQSLVARQW